MRHLAFKIRVYIKYIYKIFVILRCICLDTYKFYLTKKYMFGNTFQEKCFRFTLGLPDRVSNNT